MNKQYKDITQEKGSSKNPLGMLGVNYCFVKYSEIEDLKRSANDASIALSKVARSVSDIKLMSMRSEASEGLSQKLTATSDTKHNTQLLNRTSEPDGFATDTERISKSIVSPLPDSPSGRTRKSRRK